MKKTAAILLILIFQFNLFGYQLVISFLQQKQAVAFENKIDHIEFDESELVEISVPLNMPYQQRYTEYERCYGQVDVKGTVYHYVKRKIAGNTLVLQCIPNHGSAKLNDIRNSLTRANADERQDGPAKQAPQKSSIKTSMDEVMVNTGSFEFAAALASTKKSFSIFTFTIPAGNSKILLQPPRSC